MSTYHDSVGDVGVWRVRLISVDCVDPSEDRESHGSELETKSVSEVVVAEWREEQEISFLRRRRLECLINQSLVGCRVPSARLDPANLSFIPFPVSPATDRHSTRKSLLVLGFGTCPTIENKSF